MLGYGEEIAGLNEEEEEEEGRYFLRKRLN
jgi:hypothetical protein